MESNRLSTPFELLENRRLMTATPTLANGTLTISGDPKAGSRIDVIYGKKTSELDVTVGGIHKSFATARVDRLSITTGSGADYIYIDPTITKPSSIRTGNGNDTIRAGAGNDTIVVGNGDDLIYGKGGDNLITAGSGDNTILGDKGNDTIVAGDGNNDITGGGGTDVLAAGTGEDAFQFSSSHDSVSAAGHSLKLGGLSNGYLYSRGGEQVATATTDPNQPLHSGRTTGGSTATVVVVKSNSGSTGGHTTSGSTTGGSTSTTGANNSSGTLSSAPTALAAGAVMNVGNKQTQYTPMTSTVTAGGTYDTSAPTARITTLDGIRQTGLTVSVDGLDSSYGKGGSQTSSQFQWDFGDAGSSFDSVSGYNSEHVYDQPGTYLVKLTVTNAAGKSSTARETIKVTASTRSKVYVDSTAGSDSNRGTIDFPLKTLAAAFGHLADNTEVLLNAGRSYDVYQSLSINSTNVVVGRYGTGADPTLIHRGGDALSTIATFGNANGVTIQHVQFDSPYAVQAGQQASKIPASGVYVGGQNITVRNCTFLNLDDDVNENSNPTGVLIENNSTPLETGLRGYMVWGQGKQSMIAGNFAANSTREHIVRMFGIDTVSVVGNHFTNMDRRSSDPYDYSKGCIEMQRGENAWIADNTVQGGDIRLGPLALWGEAASSCTEHCVIQDNQLTDTMIFIKSGAHDAAIRNNVLKNENGYAININGTDSQGRISHDLTFTNNTVITTGTAGNFLRVNGWAYNITVKNNLWIAPNISMGGGGTAPVYVDYKELSGFTAVDGNVWPSPKTIGTWANGGINFVGTSYEPENFLTPSQWDQLSNVGHDTYDGVTLSSSYSITLGGHTAGSSLKMAA